MYMLATDTGRLGILKRSKFPSPSIVIRYRDVRPFICNYLADRSRNVNLLIDAEKLFEQKSEDPSCTTLMQNDAVNSIEVLWGIQKMSNKLGSFDFHLAPKKQPKLNISGVEISIYADLKVEAIIKGAKHSGAAIFRMTQDTADTEAAISKRRDMGLYVATLMRMHIDNNNTNDLPAANRLCMSIDIQHGEVFQASVNNTNRQKNIEAACRMIASHWASIAE